VQNNSKCFCMKTTMTDYWLLGGLIMQQKSSLLFFISWASNTNCIKSALLNWGVHSNYTWWLDNNFWNFQGVTFTCCHIFYQGFGATVP
jgi:hypothetical protein